jgi:hypothetical protein
MDDWTRAMRRGDFAAAWRVCDRVLEARRAEAPRGDLPRHRQWIWDGRPFDGLRALVRCYHGLGDTLQFARFLPRLAGRTRSLTVWAQPALLPLLSTRDDLGRLLPLHDGAPEGTYDVELEIMELAHAFRADAAALRQELPTFDVPAAPRLSSRFNVGLVLGAGDWDPRRRVPAELLRPLLELEDVDFFSLRPGDEIPGARPAAEEAVLAAAARARSMDLVITVDTLMAHLAGALGQRAWVLLRASADWRWMEGREDSPWYPSLRLFRQEREGDWGAPLARVREDLRKLAARGILSA